MYSITAYARPLFFDLIDNVLLDVRPTLKNHPDALRVAFFALVCLVYNFLKSAPPDFKKVIPTLKTPKYAVSAQVVHLNA